MCRVLGITNFDQSRHEALVTRFCALAKNGVVMAGDPPGHEDGWGLAFYRGGGLVVHKSGGSLLDERTQVTGLLRTQQKSPLMILHLRKSAWANTANTRHAHPFHHDNTVFFHNGVIYDYQRLLPEITVPGLDADARDTEVFFYHVLSQQDRTGELGRAFLDSVAHIRRKHTYSALNGLLSDGAKLYAYRDYAREPAYYTLYKGCADGSWLISSEPLGESIRWEPMAQQEFWEISLGTTP